jgi:hypothetical protein
MKREYRALVCGGRNFGDTLLLQETLTKLHQDRGLTRIIHGCAGGADSLAAAWACLWRIPQSGFHADWEGLGKKAGPIRNQRMIDDGRPHLVIAFPGGNGTADMVFKARRAGIEVIEVKPVAALVEAEAVGG